MRRPAVLEAGQMVEETMVKQTVEGRSGPTMMESMERLQRT